MRVGLTGRGGVGEDAAVIEVVLQGQTLHPVLAPIDGEVEEHCMAITEGGCQQWEELCSPARAAVAHGGVAREGEGYCPLRVGGISDVTSVLPRSPIAMAIVLDSLSAFAARWTRSRA